MERNIKPGDTVRHKPSGEKWTVCAVQYNSYPKPYLVPCGWPFPSITNIEDCELIEQGEGQTQDMKNALMLHGMAHLIEEE